MTAEQIERMKAGRALAKANKEVVGVVDPLHPRVLTRLREIESNTPQYLAVSRRAYVGTSKSAAIKAKCLDCSCWQRLEITHCTVITCPLWLVRPYQRDADSDDDVDCQTANP